MSVDSPDGENGSGTLYAAEMPNGGWITFARKSYTQQLIAPVRLKIPKCQCQFPFTFP